MLMGECPPEVLDNPAATAEAEREKENKKEKEKEREKEQNAKDSGSNKNAKSPKGLDILHATSAALIHALEDVLLDSDFENAMKALTAWIPVKDEDLLMKVAQAEWRRHQEKRRFRGREKA